MTKRFVIVAGNIGVGKSSLVSLLCKKLNWAPLLEPEAENPYLVDFYRDMAAWGFHSQIFFLSRRLKLHQTLMSQSESIVIDRSIYEDAEIFAQNLFIQGSLSQRDYQTYRSLYENFVSLLPPPDLVIYLRASVPTLLDRINRRGRLYEANFNAHYLGLLNNLYEDWIANFTLCPVLIIPADRLDFVSKPEHLDTVVTRLQEKLAGKDEVHFDD